MRRVFRILGAAACASVFLIGTGPASSQSLISLHGTITDPSGSAVPNATVRLSNSADNSVRATGTDQKGSYIFPDVAPGTYRLQVEAPGFENYDRIEIHIPADGLAPLDVKLTIRQVQQSVTVRGQDSNECLSAQARVLPEVGPGLRALRRTPSGNYYVLTAPGAAAIVFSPDGKRIGQVPAAPAPGASSDSSILNGSDLQVDSAGRVYVADLAANAIKIYSPDGALLRRVHVIEPISVEPLIDGEVAVASLVSKHLVDVYDEARGEAFRSFGDVSTPNAPECDPVILRCTVRVKEPGTPVNRVWFDGDSAGNLYVNLVDTSTPTVRKYDAYGYLAYESTFPLDRLAAGPSSGGWRANPEAVLPGSGTFAAAGSGSSSTTNATGSSGGGNSGADGQTRGGRPIMGEGETRGAGEGGEGGTSSGGGRGGTGEFGVPLTQRSGTGGSKPIIDAMGVDPTNHELWAAIAGNLVHFDEDGRLAGYYCLSTSDRAPIKATTILVERNRILVGVDPFGIFQYARPDQPLPDSGATR